MATSPTLAERATACAGWHWLPGMADTDGNRCERVVDGVPCFRMPGLGGLVRCPDAVPDLADGLTALGVLLLVRKAWGEPFIGLSSQDGSTWVVVRPCPYHAENIGHAIGEYIEGDSSAEALVCALECAP